MPDIDEIIAIVRCSVPEILCERLTVTHPVDDDGIWFFRLPNCEGDVQVESSSGDCPFFVEHDLTDERFVGATSDEVATKVIEWLNLRV